MVKLTISITEETKTKLNNLQTYYKTTATNVANISIEFFYWITQQQKNEYKIMAEKEFENLTVIKELPPILPKNKLFL